MYNKYSDVEIFHLIADLLRIVDVTTTVASLKKGEKKEDKDFFADFVRHKFPVELSNPWFEKLYLLLTEADEITFRLSEKEDWRQIDLYRLYDGGWSVHDPCTQGLRIVFAENLGKRKAGRKSKKVSA